MAVDELFEFCLDKQLVAKVMMILHNIVSDNYLYKGDQDKYQ